MLRSVTLSYQAVITFASNKGCMKLPDPLPVKEAAEWLGVTLKGNDSLDITGVNEIHKVEPGDLTFVDHPKYYNRSLRSAATIILINKEVEVPAGKALLISDDPFRDYNRVVQRYRTFKMNTHEIDPSAKIGANTTIQPGAVIGHDVVIGSDCRIHSNVTIYPYTIIGDRVEIHANTVIGADAFYFKRRSERNIQWDKLLSCGRVVIGTDIEIGAMCTIDKGVSGDTVIGDGTKLDCQVHIGHGAVIGQNCLFAAQVGIGGKAIIEDEVILWGQVGVSKDLRIGKGAEIYAQSGVPKSLKGGQKYFGSPAGPARQKMKEMKVVSELPNLWGKLMTWLKP